MRNQAVSKNKLAVSKTVNQIKTSSNLFLKRNIKVKLGYYCCQFCRVSFCSVGFKNRHEIRCSYRFKSIFNNDDSECFKCRYCKCLLTVRASRDRHQLFCPKRPKTIKKANEDVLLSCNYCQYKTAAKGSLKNHIVSIHERRNVYKCTFCPFYTFRNSYLTKHIDLHNSKPYIKCSLCDKGCLKKQNLDNHILKSHKIVKRSRDLITSKIHKCLLCDYETVIKSHLVRHCLKHPTSDAPKYECSDCDFFTFRNAAFQRHLKIHSGKKEYGCAVCNKFFFVKCVLDNHILFKHPNDNLAKTITSIFSCDVCSYKTVHGPDLKKHCKKH